MPKVEKVSIIIPKKKVVQIEVGQKVSTSGTEMSITEIDDTENAIYVQVDGRWYGAKTFLNKFTVTN